MIIFKQKMAFGSQVDFSMNNSNTKQMTDVFQENCRNLKFLKTFMLR